MSTLSRKEVYDKMVQESALSWHNEWQKERAKRIEIEEKYERLTRKIKENALEEVNEREVVGNDNWKIQNNGDRDYYESILDMAKDEGEWYGEE